MRIRKLGKSTADQLQVNAKAIVSTFDPLKVCLCSNRKLTYLEHPARQERGCSSGSSLAKTHLGQAKVFFSFSQVYSYQSPDEG